LKPIYEEIATRLVPRGIRLARVNAETATETQEKYSITQFPHVVIFRNGQMYPYEGPGEKAGVTGNYFIIIVYWTNSLQDLGFIIIVYWTNSLQD